MSPLKGSDRIPQLDAAPVLHGSLEAAMHLILLVVLGLTATTMPLRSQGLTKSGCDEVVTTITELSRAAAGMLIHVENSISPP